MLPFSSERYEQLRDHSLMIRLVSLRDLGPYTCQAYNGLGKAASWTVTVFANGPVEDRGDEQDREFIKFVKVPPRWGPGSRERLGTTRLPPSYLRNFTTAPTTTTTTSTERIIVPNYLGTKGVHLDVWIVVVVVSSCVVVVFRLPIFASFYG
jgi:hypothetical protein